MSEEELATADTLVGEKLKRAIRQAYDNIRRFHVAQRFVPIRVQTSPGVACEQRAVPIERVGLYIPGGSAPLFSTVLMLAIPARIAGCREIVVCTPPCRDGSVHPAILFSASLCGVCSVFKIGGAQAVAAMACGTESVPRVDKIFGPGNAYVMAAKQWVSLQGVAIDMPAGPSEVEVIADETSVPEFVAADLLSQAEHGTDSQVMLLATSRAVAEAVVQSLSEQLWALPRRKQAEKALERSRILVMSSEEDIVDFTNLYAPEHLIIATSHPRSIADRITTAGSIFLGNFSCESAGDYASGTNHTLPTLGYARAYSGLSLDSFQRKMTLQELTEEGIRSIGNTVALMADAEGLEAHAAAMRLRIKAVAGNNNDFSPSFDVSTLVRPNILSLAPYSCARDEFKGGNQSTVFLDANESPFGEKGINRYPDPLQSLVKKKLSALKGVNEEQIFLGNGSDEAIDLVFRVFCEPRRDNVVILEPSYGMYQVAAEINDVECRKVCLNPDFTFSAEGLLAATDGNTKAIFLCSPNNPTGNLLPEPEMEIVLRSFPGLVIIDEAYIDFCPDYTWSKRLSSYPRLVVLSTFSKAWASAGLRLGMAFANKDIIALFNKVKYPYNVNVLTQRHVLRLLEHPEKIEKEVVDILAQRKLLCRRLRELSIVHHIYPSDANFVLVKMEDATAAYNFLAAENIIVRNRHNVALCENCLRITIGTEAENKILFNALKKLSAL